MGSQHRIQHTEVVKYQASIFIIDCRVKIIGLVTLGQSSSSHHCPVHGMLCHTLQGTGYDGEGRRSDVICQGEDMTNKNNTEISL